MLEQFFRLTVWWFRRWYPVFRFVGRTTGNEEYVERAIEASEENIQRIEEIFEE